MNGIIIINKEKNCTSHDVVYKIKKILGEKVGHTGTLDPNATGVLPILIGKGTMLSKYLINHNKKYIATLKLGKRTNTADVEGKIIEEKTVNKELLNEQNINLIFNSMLGKQKQKPPIYSAIKINGKKLYEYARSGKTVDIPEREIEIYSLKLLNINKEQNLITFEIYCSKGTYIRTICESIAEKLYTIGFMLDLQRTMVGEFYLDKAITVSELEKIVEDNSNAQEKLQQMLKNQFISIEQFFKEKPYIVLNEKKLNLFLNGVILNLDNELIHKTNTSLNYNIIRIYNENNKFIGVGTVNNGFIKRDIIL